MTRQVGHYSARGDLPNIDMAVTAGGGQPPPITTPIAAIHPRFVRVPEQCDRFPGVDVAYLDCRALRTCDRQPLSRGIKAEGPEIGTRREMAELPPRSGLPEDNGAVLLAESQSAPIGTELDTTYVPLLRPHRG